MSAVEHDAGGSKRWALQAGVRGWACFSPCTRYRPLLARRWGAPGSPFAMWIGMNPSTAHEDVDDPTIRREISFTRALGLDGLIKANVMDYRATYPDVLPGLGSDARSGANLRLILREAKDAAVVVAAWGALPKALRPFAIETAAALRDRGVLLWCLGLTADGSPRHPLYVASGAPLVPFLGANP